MACYQTDSIALQYLDLLAM